MFFCDLEQKPSKELFPGVRIRSFWGDNMLFAITEMDPHVAMPSHSHVHEQGGVVLKGALKIWIGNEEQLLKSGDAFMIPSNVMHSAETGDVSACVINVFSPVREDYKH